MTNDDAKSQGFVSVNTNDAAVNSGDERLTQWNRQPESAVSVDTTQAVDAAPRIDAAEPDSRHRANGAGRDESLPRDKAAQAKPSAPITTKKLVLVGVAAFVLGIAGAWAATAFFGSSRTSGGQRASQQAGAKKSADKKPKSNKGSESYQGGSESGDDSASASQIVGFTSADDADALKKQLKHLDDRINRLSQRIDRVTRPENQTPPVLHTLQTHLNDLAREMDEVAGLPSRLDRLEQQGNSLREQLKSLRAQRSETAESSDGAIMGDSEVPPPSPPTAVETDPTLGLAIGLFEEGQYSQARQVLRRLQRTHPKDARVWYFSALATALASGKWKGEADKLAEQGAACERSGTPSKAEIDAALGVLTPRTGEAWLARHRGDTHHRQAKK